MIATLLNQAMLAEIGDNFAPSGRRLNWSDLWAWGLGAIVVALVVAVVVQLRKRNDWEQRCDNPWKLFRELCAAHQLDASSQRLLTQLVRIRRFEQPAQVFLTPAALEPADLPPSLRDKSDQLLKLRKHLFW